MKNVRTPQGGFFLTHTVHTVGLATVKSIASKRAVANTWNNARQIIDAVMCKCDREL